mgnify:FL=1
MKIAKKYLEVFHSTLSETSPKLPEARIRDAFLKDLLEATNTLIKDRQKIYENFCLKNEDGTNDLEDGNRFKFKAEDISKVNDELVTLYSEEVEITINPKIKEILKETEHKFKTGEVEVYDEIMKLL